MKVGDLVEVTSGNNPYFGEIGIVTRRFSNFYVKVKIPSGEFVFSPETLEVIG